MSYSLSSLEIFRMRDFYQSMFEFYIKKEPLTVKHLALAVYYGDLAHECKVLADTIEAHKAHEYVMDYLLDYLTEEINEGNPVALTIATENSLKQFIHPIFVDTDLYQAIDAKAREDNMARATTLAVAIEKGLGGLSIDSISDKTKILSEMCRLKELISEGVEKFISRQLAKKVSAGQGKCFLETHLQVVKLNLEIKEALDAMFSTLGDKRSNIEDVFSRRLAKESHPSEGHIYILQRMPEIQVMLVSAENFDIFHRMGRQEDVSSYAIAQEVIRGGLAFSGVL